jgi:hypothetical protein
MSVIIKHDELIPSPTFLATIAKALNMQNQVSYAVLYNMHESLVMMVRLFDMKYISMTGVFVYEDFLTFEFIFNGMEYMDNNKPYLVASMDKVIAIKFYNNRYDEFQATLMIPGEQPIHMEYRN